MRVGRFFLLFALFSFSVFPAAAQQTQPPAPPPQRDPQAIAVLTQSLNAAGGMAGISAIQDFTGTGTITYNWAGEAVPGHVIVYGKGLDQFRMDSNVPGGTQSFIVNGDAGTLVPLNGQKITLSPYGLMTAGSLTFPSARIAAVLADLSTSVKHLGLVTRNGSEAYRVHVAPRVDPALMLKGSLSETGEFDLYFDPVSHQLLELAEKVRANGDLKQTYLHEITFSNYNTANGLWIPFTITERFGGQQTWSIILSSITFNGGLPDSLFHL